LRLREGNCVFKAGFDCTVATVYHQQQALQPKHLALARSTQVTSAIGGFDLSPYLD
jgi:hypothetical protein